MKIETKNHPQIAAALERHNDCKARLDTMWLQLKELVIDHLDLRVGDVLLAKSWSEPFLMLVDRIVIERSGDNIYVRPVGRKFKRDGEVGQMSAGRIEWWRKPTPSERAGLRVE